ncbi:hypothetical protein LTR08_008350 [Meristemomyces frigidus]|nr:hypothetical protein LTR08_008350 [Meristemomyces frigidus]
MATRYGPYMQGSHPQLPEHGLRSNSTFAIPQNPYTTLSIDPVHASQHALPTSTAHPYPPTPSSRLAGEPAFCAGRHCCQWAVAGYTCNNHYPSAADLDHHVATHHAGRHPNGHPSGDYHCHWAGCCKPESFGNKPKLTRHIHSHTGHKPHQCHFPDCGKGFVTKEQLKNHETTHTRTKEHVCPECGKGFAVKTALTSHMNVHKGAKPYVCDECGKGFADSSNLSKHKAIHKRAGLKKSHTRRQSENCHTCADPGSLSSFGTLAGVAAAASPYAPAFHRPYLPDDFAATPSIESSAGQLTEEDYCGLPCFDAHCPDNARIPCRSASPCKSAPCSIRACSEPCVFPPCEADACEHEQIACDSPDCDLTEDVCLQFCGDHFDCFCPSDDEGTTGTLPTPSTGSAVLDHSAYGRERVRGGHAAVVPSEDTFHVEPGTAGGGSHVPTRYETDCGLSEGFKQLNDFIHGDFCGCMDETIRFG